MFTWYVVSFYVNNNHDLFLNIHSPDELNDACIVSISLFVAQWNLTWSPACFVKIIYIC